jgi:hypothetical protein
MKFTKEALMMDSSDEEDKVDMIGLKSDKQADPGSSDIDRVIDELN